MKHNESINVRIIENGFVITPAGSLYAKPQDTHVFSDSEKMGRFISRHFDFSGLISGRAKDEPVCSDKEWVAVKPCATGGGGGVAPAQGHGMGGRGTI